MKKNILCILITIILFIVCSIQEIVNATNQNKNDFFTSNKTEVTLGEIVELTLDIEKIEYDSFNFVLFSDTPSIKMEDVYTENVETTVEEDELNIYIDKSKIELNKIILYYKVPEDLVIGDTIILKAKKEEKQGNVVESNNTIEQTNMINNELASNETQEIEIKLTIVKENIDKDDIINNEQTDQETNTNQSKEDINIDNNELIEKNTIDNNKTNLVEDIQSENNNIKNNDSNMNNSQNSDKITQSIQYNGSDNNYLKSLTIEGEDFYNEFSKENTTYFLSVGENIDEIEVSAEAEDDNATICIYGNTSLQEGSNKILINVTAENGNVRTYRFFVTKS